MRMSFNTAKPMPIKPNWNTIDTLLLDMDGTLLDLHFDNQFWMELVPMRWGELNGYDLNAAKEQLFPLFARHHGSLNWYCLDFWSNELALPIAALKRDIAHLIGYLPDVEPFLQAAQSKRLVLMTNAHRDSLDLKVEMTGLDKYFAADGALMLSAHDFGLAKEEDGFWNLLENKLGFSPDRTLMVDDSTSVLDTAAAHGIFTAQALAPDSAKPANTAEVHFGVTSLMELVS